MTKVKGAHNLKTGIFVEHTTRPAQRSSTFNGITELQHGRFEPAEHERRVRQRPARRGHAVSGVERPPVAHGQFMNTEFYVQDNWRVRRNFTIDAGVRFYYITPTQSAG